MNITRLAKVALSNSNLDLEWLERRPIDAILNGKYGCVVHLANSDRVRNSNYLDAIEYCFRNGLQPSLLVLNKNSKNTIDVLFDPQLREPTSKVSSMKPIATNVDTELTDTASFYKMFSKSKKSKKFIKEAVRLSENIYILNVLKHDGKLSHTIRRCKNCGGLNKSAPKKLIACSTCRMNPDHHVSHNPYAKVSTDKNNNLDISAKMLDWKFSGVNKNGWRMYTWDDQWSDDEGCTHTIAVTSSDDHSKYMRQCMSGKCNHPSTLGWPLKIEALSDNNELLQAGTKIIKDSSSSIGYLLDTKGGMAVFYRSKKKSAANDSPDYTFIYYRGALLVEKWHHNHSYHISLNKLIKDNGMSIDIHFETSQVAAGVVYDNDSMKIEHEQLSNKNVKKEAEEAVRDWLSNSKSEKPDSKKDKKPDYAFVSYADTLKIVNWHHNIHFTRLTEELLKDYGYESPLGLESDIDFNNVATGYIYDDEGKTEIEHLPPTNKELQSDVDKLIRSELNGGDWNTVEE